MLQLNSSAPSLAPFQSNSRSPQPKGQQSIISLPAVDTFSTQAGTSSKLQHGKPFTLTQAQSYIQQQWNSLGLGKVPPPQMITIKAGDTPAFADHQIVPMEEWQAMQPTVPSNVIVKQKVDEDGKPGMEVQNVILMPEEALSKGMFGILAHELNHATAYPKRAAAIMAGKIPPLPGEQIPSSYMEQVKAAGFDRNPAMVNEGVYRSKLFADSEVYGPKMVKLNQDIEKAEANHNEEGFRFSRLLKDYKESFAQYFSSPEELQGFLIYANLKGDPNMQANFKRLYTALDTRNKPMFSSAIDQLCEYGVSEGHLKGRRLAPLPNHVIDGIFHEWNQNQQLLNTLNR
jgi:hypothetical protein